jgi:hypothetical protein
MEMTFGKYEGTEVAELPDGYLKWLHNEADVWNEELAEEIASEYYQRFSDDDDDPLPVYEGPATPTPRPRPPPTPVIDMFDDVWQAGARVMAPKYKGQAEKMLLFNRLTDAVRWHIAELRLESLEIEDFQERSGK